MFAAGLPPVSMRFELLASGESLRRHHPSPAVGEHGDPALPLVPGNLTRSVRDRRPRLVPLRSSPREDP